MTSQQVEPVPTESGIVTDKHAGRAGISGERLVGLRIADGSNLRLGTRPDRLLRFGTLCAMELFNFIVAFLGENAARSGRK